MLELCINSKFLYDQALYVLRQDYFNHYHRLTLSKYDLINHMVQSNNDFYRKYPVRIGKETLLTTFESFKSFTQLNKLYKKGELHFKPKLPKYLSHKNINLFQTTFNKEAILGVNKSLLNQLSIDPNYKNLINDYNKHKDTLDIIRLSGTNIYFLLPKSIRSNIVELNIIPKSNYFNIHIVYDKQIPLSSNTIQYDINTNLDKAINDIKQHEVKNEIKKEKVYCGIDLGVSNLLTLVFSDGHNPIIIDGSDIKSYNQYYNKEVSRLRSKAIKCNGLYTTNRIKELCKKRNDKIESYLHEISKKIVDYLVMIKVDEVIIGKNDGWKQNTKGKLHKKTNQLFQHIPYTKLIHMLDYKLDEYGIKLTITEESYTSKCSFMDNEEIKKHKYYKGKRVKRGLFKTASGKYINADVNGAYNIIKKVIPIFGWSEALSVKPIKYKLNKSISLISYISEKTYLV